MIDQESPRLDFDDFDKPGGAVTMNFTFIEATPLEKQLRPRVRRTVIRGDVIFCVSGFSLRRKL